MNYETYNDLQMDYFLLSQSNSNFYEHTTDKQFKFINNTLAKRYKADYKALVKYEKQKRKKIKKIYNRNKKKFGVVSISLAKEMFFEEQQQVFKLNNEFEKHKFKKKKQKLLNKLKIGSKTPIRRTVQGISSSQNSNEAKKEI